MKLDVELDMRGNNIKNCPSLVKEKTLSYDEYQALSDEEKNDGTTYYVPDMPVSDTYTTYSTEEIVVGRWIDGKPIYRKVIVTSNTSIDVSSFNIESISDVRYFVKTSNNYIFPGAYGYASNNMISAYFINGYSTISIAFARPDSFSSATIILEYTKTTD